MCQSNSLREKLVRKEKMQGVGGGKAFIWLVNVNASHSGFCTPLLVPGF